MPKENITNCYKKIKDVKFQQISTTQLLANPPKRKSYWLNQVKRIEKLQANDARKHAIKSYDLSTNLPPKLYKNVANILKIPPIKADLFEEEIKEDDHQIPEKITKHEDESSMKSFNDSTCSEILMLDKRFVRVELTTEENPIKIVKNLDDNNWQSEYICNKRKERIKWGSKYYKLDKQLLEKHADEQAEDMMDSVAERFTGWLNTIGTEETNISKDFIRSLFTIDSGAKLLGGVKVDPKVIKSVPHYVAETWNMPEMSMRKKLENKIAERKDKIPKNVIKVAFNRTMPYHMRPWVPSDADAIIEPVCPEELKTREVIFQGIGHLKSTKELLKYYAEHPHVERPKYLIDHGWFKHKAARASRCEIPLHELFNIEKS